MSYKSSNFRRSEPTKDAVQDKYRPQVDTLREMFPAWSNDDLSSVLTEVHGDVALAATRITEGHAEQWGAVNRKKDKKPAPPSAAHAHKDSFGGRGARGGRGGRGGPMRGGAAPRGGARGAFAGRGGHMGVNGNSNGHGSPAPAAAAVSTDGAWGAPDAGAWAEDAPKVLDADDQDWGAASTTATAAESEAAPAPSTTAVSSANGVGTPSVKSPPIPAAKPKTPATSKMSWAQIARPQEKPAPPPPQPAAPAPAPIAHAPAPPALTPEPPAPVAEPEPESQPTWEEPTTAEPPVWDDAPQAPPALAEPWPPSIDKTIEETKVEPPPAPAPEPIPEPAPSALPAQVRQQQTHTPEPSVGKPTTPAPHTRPAGSHRSNPRFKAPPDQAVIMPSNFGTTMEKMGMQFGSFGLSGDSAEDVADVNAPEPTAAPEPAPAAPAPAPEPAAPPALPQQVHEPAPPVVSPPSATGGAPGLFPSPLPQQAQAQPPMSQPQPQHSIPTALAHASMQGSQSAASTSPLQSYAHQSSISQQPLSSLSQQPQSHLPQQHQQQQQQQQLPPNLQSYSQQQHNLSALETAQPQHAPQPTHHQSTLGHSSYFRQAEPPYFHTPTPPAGQAQASPYGAFGQQLNQGLQHQNQASNLGGFGGGDDYGYNDRQASFYDSYQQPGSFGGRAALGHDELKGLPSQAQHAAGLNASNAQPSQHQPPSSQTGSQGHQGGQAPQQGYGGQPPTMPYYYPYPGNQYYGSPYNSPAGYGVPQPFVKYPTMFQPGPPGPGSAPSPAGKPAQAGAQNPYAQGLYGAQHQQYDDLGYQQHGHGSAAAGGEYGKPLYGGGQNFMAGLQSGTPPVSQQRGGGSPETAYKPYGQKEVPQGRAQPGQQAQGGFYGAGRLAQGQQQQGQPHQQAQPQGQPQSHLGYQGGSDGGFYSGYQPRQQQYWQ